jgi:hypothetical protein
MTITEVYDPHATLDGWALRSDGENQLILVLDGTYGLPVIHRAGCRTRPSHEHPSIDATDVLELWLAEHIRISFGATRTIHFCEKCLIRRVPT